MATLKNNKNSMPKLRKKSKMSQNSLDNLKKAPKILDTMKRLGLKPGRPKGSKAWVTILEDEFKNGKVTKDYIAKVLIYKAAKGDLRAIEIIIDRMDGKANQPIEINSKTFLDLIREGREKMLPKNESSG